MSRPPTRMLVAGRVLQLSLHAIERYQERVRMTLTFEQATEDLVRVLALAEFGERPAWANRSAEAGDLEEWLLLGDAIVFPVFEGRITTCIARGEVGAEVRVTKAKIRQERAARGARKKHGKVARSERRRAKDAREAME